MLRSFRYFAAAILVTGLASAQAQAQVADTDQYTGEFTSQLATSGFKLIDGNGIDEISLSQYFPSTLRIGIGGKGSGLAYIPRGFGFTTFSSIRNFIGYIGGQGDVFNGEAVGSDGQVPTSNSCTGTFTTCTIILKDGTQAIYTKVSSLPTANEQIFMTQEIKPDGEVITYNYRYYTGSQNPNGYNRDASIRSISSSLGWTIKFNNQNNDPNNEWIQSIEAINESVDYCDPTVDTCSGLTVNWPQVNVAFNGMSHVITTPAGEKITYNMVNSKVGAEYYSFDSNSYVLEQLVSSTVTSSGVTTTYNIISPGDNPYNRSEILGGVMRGGSTWAYTTSSSNTLMNTNSIDPDSNTTTTVFDTDNGDLYGIDYPDNTSVGYWFYQLPSGLDCGFPNEIHGPAATSVESASQLSQDDTQLSKTSAIDSRCNVTSVTLHVPGTPNTSANSMVTQQASFPASCDMTNFRYCNKPTWTKDGNGNETDYTYDPAHGGVLTETGPADSSGVRPQKRYTYSQLTPMVKNPSGQLVASTPVYRLISVSECMTATAANPASCVGTANEKVMTYAYNNNNLLMTSVTVAAGDNSASSTVNYGYDVFGNLTSTKGPRTDVDDSRYTTYDAEQRPVYEIGADPDGSGPLPRVIIHHLYDGDGREWRTETGTGNATNGSDFTIASYVQKTYDPTSGLPVKTVTATVP